jgi:hypothetical protein
VNDSDLIFVNENANPTLVNENADPRLEDIEGALALLELSKKSVDANSNSCDIK